MQTCEHCDPPTPSLPPTPSSLPHGLPRAQICTSGCTVGTLTLNPATTSNGVANIMTALTMALDGKKESNPGGSSNFYGTLQMTSTVTTSPQGYLDPGQGTTYNLPVYSGIVCGVVYRDGYDVNALGFQFFQGVGEAFVHGMGLTHTSSPNCHTCPHLDTLDPTWVQHSVSHWIRHGCTMYHIRSNMTAPCTLYHIGSGMGATCITLDPTGVHPVSHSCLISHHTYLHPTPCITFVHHHTYLHPTPCITFMHHHTYLHPTPCITFMHHHTYSHPTHHRTSSHLITLVGPHSAPHPPSHLITPHHTQIFTLDHTACPLVHSHIITPHHTLLFTLANTACLLVHSCPTPTLPAYPGHT